MALMPHRDLLKLPVFTKSGVFLGTVVQFDVELDAQRLHSYTVRQRRLLVPSGEFAVSREQVISIDRTRMIVDDAVVAVTSAVQRKQGVAPQTVPTNS